MAPSQELMCQNFGFLGNLLGIYNSEQRFFCLFFCLFFFFKILKDCQLFGKYSDSVIGID